MRPGSIALSFVVLVGCDDALVGGECLDGHREVEGTCVPTDVPGSGNGGEGGSLGATLPGATSEGGGRPPTSSSTGAGGGSSSGSGSPGVPCHDGLVACDGTCVDLRSDPRHCGACGNVCASGICEAGVCQGELAGHVVLYGFDADEVGGVAPARIVGNAMFAWPIDPVRVAVLRAPNHPGTVLEDVATAEASARGRSAALETIVDHEAMATRLEAGAVDVVFVAALPQVAADAASAGDRLASGIAALTARGGVIVVLAPEEPAAFGPFVQSLGVATDVTADAAATGVLDVVAFDDALAAGLPSFFARPAATLAFEAPTLGGRVVVADRAGRAVVVHGVVDPNE